MAFLKKKRPRCSLNLKEEHGYVGWSNSGRIRSRAFKLCSGSGSRQASSRQGSPEYVSFESKWKGRVVCHNAATTDRWSVTSGGGPQ